MVKKTLIIASLSALCNTAFAGGFLTNTNQSVSFLRMPAQEGFISVEGAYYNPAGIGFLNNGWHLSFSAQSAYQHRNATSHYAGYAYGVNNQQSTKKLFQSTASAPFVPSLSLGFVKDRWFGSFHFGLTGGGGKATYKNGLGSFESFIATLPMVVNALGTGVNLTGYEFNSYMHGRQYHFGAQIGAGYRFTDKFSVSIGGRVVYATASYDGYVNNIDYQNTGMPNATIAPLIPLLTPYITAAKTLLQNGISLDAEQKGWGFTPIIGVNWKINDQWNIGAKYEFKTKLRLNTTSNLTEGTTAYSVPSLAKFRNGTKMPNDIPAIAALGAQYKPSERLRIGLAGHLYFDKDAKQYNNEQQHLAGNSWEILAGAEYDITDRWTASLGGQHTNYSLGKNSKYISDISFNTDSYSFGLGVKFKVNDKVSINASYFKTFYNAYERTATDYNNIGATLGGLAQGLVSKVTAALTAGKTDTEIADFKKTDTYKAIIGATQAIPTMQAAGAFKGADHFDRTNDVFGVGVDIRF